MPTTTNMGMVLPTVGVTVDPTWASNLNDALTDKVDVHDHTTGLGVQVPTAGLNINDDLSFQSNDAIDLRSVALNNNVATLPSGDIRALYASGGDLYYNNNSGNPVRITSGSNLDTGSLALNVWELTELAGNLTILYSDSFVVVNTDTSAARTINLPAASSVTAGRYFTFKDKTGDAATFNITIVPNGSDTIDEAASSTTVNTSYGSLTLISDGVSNWLTNASLGGFVKLGGDLLGDGSSVLAPRVGTLTGIAGLITFDNNVALNTRNLADNANINVAKVNTSNILKLGDTSFESDLDGTILRLVASTGNAYLNSAIDTWIEAGNNIEIQSPNDLLIGVINDANVEVLHNLTNQVNNDIAWTIGRNWGSTVAGHYSMAGGGNVTVTGAGDGYFYAYNEMDVRSNNTYVNGDVLLSLAAPTTTILATTLTIDVGTSILMGGPKVTTVGKIYMPTKAVTSSPYTVDTTTNDYIIFVDSTGGAISINLPAADNGRVLFIQDVGGAANTNNITLVRNGSDTIQGVGANYVMDADYQGVTLAAYSGNSWFIIGTQ